MMAKPASLKPIQAAVSCRSRESNRATNSISPSCATMRSTRLFRSLVSRFFHIIGRPFAVSFPLTIADVQASAATITPIIATRAINNLLFISSEF